MKNSEHVKILRQGVETWNIWRAKNPDCRPQLDDTIYKGGDLRNINLRHADLRRAVLDGTILAYADLAGANLSDTSLEFANLTGADLTGANLARADLTNTYLCGANLTDANLRGCILVKTDLDEADISGCQIFGISAWKVKTEGLIQSNLVITDYGEAEVVIDDLEVAQFVYLLLNNKKLSNVITTLTTKSVLILGRFTPERKALLEAIRQSLRHQGYLPILFDFDKPNNRDLTETLFTLASLSRFVIADLSDPNSIPHELMSFAERLLSVPIQAIFCPTNTHTKPYPLYEHLQRLPHVLPIYNYYSADELISTLSNKVIRPAEEKVKI